jgi:hypothetical protein
LHWYNRSHLSRQAIALAQPLKSEQAGHCIGTTAQTGADRPLHWHSRSNLSKPFHWYSRSDLSRQAIALAQALRSEQASHFIGTAAQI